MIEPVEFQYNTETAVNNYFQKQTLNAQSKALEEFKNMVSLLKSKGVDVITVKDTKEPATPDSIFPNNWVSFHSNGKVVLYPMYAENRRKERRLDLLETLKNQGFIISEIIDITKNEKEGIFLEGTGSMILDRVNKIAYAAVSPRTNKNLFEDFCQLMGYTPIVFTAYQTHDNQLLEIYHTNVMMCVASNVAVVCLDSITSQDEKDLVINALKSTQKEIVDISEQQMHQFAGNMLEVKGNDEKPILVMSETAFASLNSHQINTIEEYNSILSIPIPTIETNGGGSVRCMMAEVFLPKS